MKTIHDCLKDVRGMGEDERLLLAAYGKAILEVNGQEGLIEAMICGVRGLSYDMLDDPENRDNYLVTINCLLDISRHTLQLNTYCEGKGQPTYKVLNIDIDKEYRGEK